MTCKNKLVEQYCYAKNQKVSELKTKTKNNSITSVLMVIERYRKKSLILRYSIIVVIGTPSYDRNCRCKHNRPNIEMLEAKLGST